jgi:hypothetical protein
MTQCHGTATAGCHHYPSWNYALAGCERCPDMATAGTMTQCHGSGTSGNDDTSTAPDPMRESCSGVLIHPNWVLTPAEVCVCVYMCMRVQVCAYACMYACMHVCMYACMYVCLHACVYVPRGLVGCHNCCKERVCDMCLAWLVRWYHTMCKVKKDARGA